MATHTCADCGAHVASQAKRCPPCRHRRRNRQTHACRVLRQLKQSRAHPEDLPVAGDYARRIEARYQRALAAIRASGACRLTDEQATAQRASYEAQWGRSGVDWDGVALTEKGKRA